jgi:uncharacterized repeat protein (TIGR01451 family)
VKKVSFLSVVALAAFGAMVLAGAGSAAKPTSAASAPRAQSSWTAPGVVRQVGLRNYAGPNCPGKGWNCTTATRVVQVASAGGTNSFVCSPSSSGTAPPTTCVINQIGGATNTARCTEQNSSSNVSLSCQITQTGTSANYAYVNQNINQTDNPTQIGTEKAVVTQGPASVTNFLQVGQAVNQSSKVASGGTQKQFAYQSLTVTQTAATGSSGTNYAAVNQTQLQKEYARSTVQEQDTSDVPSGSSLPDCNPATPPNGPGAPNVCANIAQSSDAGANTNQLRQNVNEDQNSTGVATQTQGNGDGGLDSRVHQETNTGTSSNAAVLSKNQHQTAAVSSLTHQFQNDPVSCCGFASQVGGTNNTDSINLSSALSASGDSSPDQNSDLIGTTHHDPNDGSCTIAEKASINIDSTNNTESFPTCPEFLLVETSCSSGSEDAGCPSSPTVETFPPVSSLTKGVCDETTNFECTPGPSTDAFQDDTLSYQIVYSNSANVPIEGMGIARNVVVTDPIPSGVDPNSIECDVDVPCTVDTEAGTITWDLGDVSPDSSITMAFTASVTAEAGTTFTNTATGTDDEEPQFSSNPASVTVQSSEIIP